MNYQITRQSKVVLISLAGSLTREHLPALEKLREELAALEFDCVILHFKGVSDRADRNVLPQLALLQKAVRDKGARVCLASLTLGLRQNLELRGVVRRDECFEDLPQTLQWLARIGARPAAA